MVSGAHGGRRGNRRDAERDTTKSGVHRRLLSRPLREPPGQASCGPCTLEIAPLASGNPRGRLRISAGSAGGARCNCGSGSVFSTPSRGDSPGAAARPPRAQGLRAAGAAARAPPGGGRQVRHPRPAMAEDIRLGVEPDDPRGAPRRALGEDDRLFRTVHGFGYAFDGEVDRPRLTKPAARRAARRGWPPASSGRTRSSPWPRGEHPGARSGRAGRWSTRRGCPGVTPGSWSGEPRPRSRTSGARTARSWEIGVSVARPSGRPRSRAARAHRPRVPVRAPPGSTETELP